MTTVTLDSVNEGARVVVREVRHHGGITLRLYRLGILPGAHLEVVANRGRGPVVVRVKGVEVAIGRGLARTLLVEVVGDEKADAGADRPA